MNDKITSIAAALVAKAGTNASAGIGALTSESDSTGADGTRKRVTSCMHLPHSNNGTLERIGATKHVRGQSSGGGSGSAMSEHKHQIGTSLADLKVCWHKPTWPEQCFKCGEPFYMANQFSCENCKSDESPIAGTLRSDFYDLDSPTLKQFQNPSTADMYNSSTLLSIIETNNNNIQLITDDADSKTTSTNSTLSKQLPLVEYLTRKNFEDEFSSLIINSTCSSAHFVTSFVSDTNKKKMTQPANTTLINRNLAEQIKLYNKYNNSKLTELKYELREENSLLVTGLLKIHWNLKQPIQLSTALSNEESNDQSLKSEQQTNFKATLLKDFSQKKKTSYDDSSLSKKNKQKAPQIGSGRAQTVNCKPNKWKRPGLNMNDDAKEPESQNFIPAYASVSSIRIDSQVTCQKAIQILLDKYHISNPPSKYSLYKCYQSGETRELEDDSFPLIERIWMGPFSEDKLFIMEKGGQLNNNQEVSNLMCLPESLLQNLLDNLAMEESKEIENVTAQFLKYQEILVAISSDIEKEMKPSVVEEITTSCRM